MKRIAFIHPQATVDKATKIWSSALVKSIIGENRTRIVSLNAMIFGALTPKDKFDFVFYDETVEPIDAADIDADLVAITALSVTSDRAYALAGDFRTRGIPVVIGGIHATVHPEEAAQHADAIFIGMGEHTWPAFLEDFERGSFKKVYDAKDYPPVTEFVSPRLDIIRYPERYLTWPIMATRGCPYNCEFCSIEHSSGHRYLMKPIEQVIAEIRAYEAFAKPGMFGKEKPDYYFVDDNFYVNREYTKKLLEALAKEHITWNGQGTINTAADEEIVALLAKSGCRAYTMGFESLTEENLAKMRKLKGGGAPEYKKALDNLMKYGIQPSAYFIFGLDGDDDTVFERTVQFARENALIQCIFSVLTPYPGTQLEKRLLEEGRITADGYMLYNNWNVVITPKKMSCDELQRGFYWALKQTTTSEFLKNALKQYWAHGPWPDKPPFTLVERAALVGLWLLLWPHKEMRDSANFFRWVAFQKKAGDFRGTISIMMSNEMTNKINRLYYNPAERRRAREAAAKEGVAQHAAPKIRGVSAEESR